MAHTQNYDRIYVDREGHVGLSVDEVRHALGSRSLDLGTLCTHHSINRWSKYKPFDNPAMAFSDDESYEDARKAANYGMPYIPYFKVTPSDDLLRTPALAFAAMMKAVHEQLLGIGSQWIARASNYDALKEPWTHTPVEGAYRLLDFDGYAQFAQQFIADTTRLLQETLEPDDQPEFIMELGAKQGALRAQDIRAVKRSGMIESGTDPMYVGLGFYYGDGECSGLTIGRAESLDLAGESALVEADDVPFRRSDDSYVVTCAFLANAPVAAGGTDGVITDATVFIPVLPSMNQVLMHVVPIDVQMRFDSVEPWVVSGNRTTFISYLRPNASLYYNLEEFSAYIGYWNGSGTLWCSFRMNDPDPAFRADLYRAGDPADRITLLVEVNAAGSSTTASVKLVDHAGYTFYNKVIPSSDMSGAVKSGTAFSQAAAFAAQTLFYGKTYDAYELSVSAQTA